MIDPTRRQLLAALSAAAAVRSSAAQVVPGTDAAARPTGAVIQGLGQDLRNFGQGVGTGSARVDTAAWQAALDSLASTGSRRLIVPAGQYLIENTIRPPATLSSIEIVGAGGYDGIRGPLNRSLFTSLKWVGKSDQTAAVVQFDRASGCVWRGVSLDCNRRAGYGIQLMSSTDHDPSVKNILENFSVHGALRDGIIVGEWGEPTATPGQRQFFGNVFRNLTFYGCGASGIHINEYNADQQYFDTVMTYLDDAAVPQNALNGFWFDSGGQHSTLINCQSGGHTVVGGVASSGFMIRNQKADLSSGGGAHGLTAINCWQEGEGGFYYGITSTEDHKAFEFIRCASFTNDPDANYSVYIDKGTSEQIPYTFDTCTFLGDVKIESTTFNKESLALTNCIFGNNGAGPTQRGVIDPNGARTVDGAFAHIGTTGNIFVAPRFADLVQLTLSENVAALYTEGVSKKGDRLTIVLTQDATGGRTANWAGSTNFSAGPAIPQPNPVPGAKTTYLFVSDGAIYYLVSITGGSVRGAMAKKSADQTTADYSAAPAIAWDTEIYDNAGLHDNVTNNSRFTVPAGISFVEVGCNLSLALVDSDVVLSLKLKKNGSVNFDGTCGKEWNSGNNTDPEANVRSGPIPVVPGDYFEWRLYCADVSITVVAARSSFWMRVLA